MQPTFKQIYNTTNTAKVLLKLLDNYSPKVCKKNLPTNSRMSAQSKQPIGT